MPVEFVYDFITISDAVMRMVAEVKQRRMLAEEYVDLRSAA